VTYAHDAHCNTIHEAGPELCPPPRDVEQFAVTYMKRISIVDFHEDGSASGAAWDVRGATADAIRESLGAPHWEQLMPADAVKRMVEGSLPEGVLELPGTGRPS
jgi:hypothetical protein